MVRIIKPGKTPARVPSNGSKRGAKQPVPQDHIELKKQPEKEKGILSLMLELINDDLHGRNKKLMVDQEEVLNDWKGKL